MIIVAGGDSFVWGSELADSPHGGQNGYSRNTFTALLSKDLKYVCAAYPGNGNDAIARNVIVQCESNKSDNIGVIVSWTFTGRFEFNFSFNNTPNWQTINYWSVGDRFNEVEEHKHLIEFQIKKAKQNGSYDFAVSWFKYLGTEYWEIYHSLKEILFLQLYLKLNRIPFLFTCAESEFLNTETIKNGDASISALYKQIDFDKWFFFPNNKGFYTWALENKYKIGQTHPLEDAHLDAANLMKEKFNELVKKPLEQNNP